MPVYSCGDLQRVVGRFIVLNGDVVVGTQRQRLVIDQLQRTRQRQVVDHVAAGRVVQVATAVYDQPFAGGHLPRRHPQVSRIEAAVYGRRRQQVIEFVVKLRRCQHRSGAEGVDSTYSTH